MPRPPRTSISPDHVQRFIMQLFQNDLHAARVKSLANGVSGVLHSASLGVSAIGRGLAAARGLVDKHAIKQTDRLLANPAIGVAQLTAVWVRSVLEGWEGPVFVNLDWTEFDSDDQSMLVLAMQGDGRSVPLMWKTVVKSELKGKRNNHEDDLLNEFHAAVPEGVQVVVVADRGFCDQQLLTFLTTELEFDYIIRIRKDITVTSAKGDQRHAGDWVTASGRLRRLVGATVTLEHTTVGQFVAVHDKAMKDPWLLVCSRSEWTGTEIKKRYGRRFTCEETFRDIKDLRFGMGMSWGKVTKPDRRDRMMLLATLVHTLLTELGAAGEDAGLDRLLKSNTSKRRTLSQFRQGCRWYELIPSMPAPRLRKLMNAFAKRIRRHPVFSLLISVPAK